MMLLLLGNVIALLIAIWDQWDLRKRGIKCETEDYVAEVVFVAFGWFTVILFAVFWIGRKLSEKA